MSQSGSESDIWEYKPLKKTKRRSKSQKPSQNGAKKRKEGKVEQTSNIKVQSEPETNTDLNQDCDTGQTDGEERSSGSGPHDDHITLEKESQSGGFCPVCQMPFSVLVVQSHQWHVAECLDTPGEDCNECPDGLQCSSSIPSHYKRYSHSLLAHSRALNDSVSCVPTQTNTIKTTSNVNAVSDVAPSCVTESSVDSAVNLSLSSQSSSPGDGVPRGTPTHTNALLLLRSPNTEDIKKKKGWSPSTKKSQSLSSSQEFRVNSSTPVKAHCVDSSVQTESNKIKEEIPAVNEEDYISYSPLSELPDVDEVLRTQQTNKKLLFDNTVIQGDESEVDCEDDDDDDDDSLQLFSMEDDDLFNDMMVQYETQEVNSREEGPNDDSLDTCVKLEMPLTPVNHLITSCSTGVSDGTGQHGPHLQSMRNHSTTNSEGASINLQSPQSLVLERLRERISNPAHTSGLDTEVNGTYKNQDLSSTKPLSISQKTHSMAPRRTQAGPSGLKQTDIGVFFGLKPLSNKKADVEDNQQRGSRRAKVSEAHVEDSKRQGRQRRKSRAPSELSGVSSTAEDGTTQPTQTEGERGGRAAGRKRWNRGRATDGGPEEPRRCPFYKKIPGTGFAVDAFHYGVIEGVTAYFLTHFHSDHYNGLRKDSAFPIYCNKITGNLVKSKLRVDEQYVHILPMNTECTVRGVRVTLLDANHCPGAAMLLFVLPDGQTVLHTGDFRADPSMERYPELQDLRIQTLYLDTTYCSPEYTFPTQQEVITFAVNTAFEQVTLNPRTLVVCGTYAVGKEKVFLAVSEVLGSKVCLSKDKYNTMCCLDSEQIDQRITTDWHAAQVHVLPMMQLNFKNLRTHLNKFSRKYDQLVAFKPTGWTFNQTVRVDEIQPQTQGNISIYGVPYSEHSSYLELKRFVQWLRPKKIIPTVNVGSWRSRKAMERCFHEWQTEPRNLSSAPQGLRNSNSGTKQ